MLVHSYLGCNFRIWGKYVAWLPYKYKYIVIKYNMPQHPVEPIQFMVLLEDKLVSSKWMTESYLTSACGACCGLQHLRGHKVDLGIVCGLDTTFDPQHLPNSVLISMADLKFLPGLPEISSNLKHHVHKYNRNYDIIIGNFYVIQKQVMAEVFYLTLGSQIWEQ